MFDSALGGNRGVAKNADSTIVRWPVKISTDKTTREALPGRPEEASYSIEAWIDALDKIYSDILTKQIEGRAVINHSFGFPRDFVEEQNPFAFQLVTDRYKDLVDSGVVLVAAAGNEAPQVPTVDEYPALFAGGDIPSFIVFGAVETTLGITSQFSQGDPPDKGGLVTVGAPGQGIMTHWELYKDDIEDDGTIDGTSSACAFTSGLAASLLVEMQAVIAAEKDRWVPITGRLVKQMVQKLAYPRVTGGLPVIFNGQRWAGPQADVCQFPGFGTQPPSNGKRKRRAGNGPVVKGLRLVKRDGEEIEFEDDDSLELGCEDGADTSSSSSSASPSTMSTSFVSSSSSLSPLSNSSIPQSDRVTKNKHLTAAGAANLNNLAAQSVSSSSSSSSLSSSSSSSSLSSYRSSTAQSSSHLSSTPSPSPSPSPLPAAPTQPPPDPFANAFDRKGCLACSRLVGHP